MFRRGLRGSLFDHRLFETEDNSGGTPPSSVEEKPDESPDPSSESKPKIRLEDLPEDQQRFVRSLIKQAREDGRRATEAAAEAARKAAEDEANQRKLEAEGKYEEAKQQLLDRATTAEQRVAELEAKTQRYAELVQAQIERLKAEVPAEALKGFDEQADPLDQIAFLTDRKELVDALIPASKRDGTTPKLPNGGEGSTRPVSQQEDEERKRWEEARREQMRREF